MNIGDMFTIPDTRLPNLIPDLKTIYNKFVEDDVDYPTLATVWGHTNARSGTFLSKKATMITYGLIEGRGKVHITETGRKIAQIPENKKELNEGLIEAISNIPLWKELFEKYTKNGLEIPIGDFWLDLRQICHISPEEAKNKAEMVRKAYLEDIVQIEPPKGGDSDLNETGVPTTPPAGANTTPENPPVSPSDMMMFNVDGITLGLPKEGTKDKWKKFKEMIDIYIRDLS